MIVVILKFFAQSPIIHKHKKYDKRLTMKIITTGQRRVHKMRALMLVKTVK